MIRIWGSEALKVAEAVFRPIRGVRLGESAPGRLRLGRIGRGLGDEVVVFVQGGESPEVEVQCHGGSAAVGLVLEALEEAGARRPDRSGTGETAIGDLIAAQALADLPFGPTLLTAEILLDQWHGAFRRDVERIGLAIEQGPEPALAELDGLIGRAAIGLRLLPGWKVVIAGRPNVGKSRLLNALAGFQRAIVDPTPGTTRDVVTVRTAFAGWPVELADTAGLRGTDDVIENQGIARSLREQEKADLILLVLDRSAPIRPDDRELVAERPDAILVVNKADLPPAWQESDHPFGAVSMVTVSAERGDGIPDLIAAVIGRLVPDPPRPGDAVPFRQGQLDDLRRARADLEAGNTAIARLRLLRMMVGPHDPVDP